MLQVKPDMHIEIAFESGAVLYRDEAILLGPQHLDQLAGTREQRGQGLRLLIRQADFGFNGFTEVGQYSRVNLVGLGQLACGFGEVTRLTRIVAYMISKSQKLLLYTFILIGLTSNIYHLYLRKTHDYNFLSRVTIILFIVGFMCLILSDLINLMRRLSYLRNPSNPTNVLIAAKGSTALLKKLVDNGADVNVHQVMTGITPLMFAVEAKKAENVKILIAAGADVNARNMLGGIALMEAVRRGLEEIAKILLEAGSNANAKDNFGTTTFDIATNQSNVEMKKLLSRYEGS